MEKKLIGKLCPFRRQTQSYTKTYNGNHEETTKQEFFMQCDPNCMFYYERSVITPEQELARLAGEDLSLTQMVSVMSCRRCEQMMK